MLLCVDDALVASYEAEDVVQNQIGKYFALKNGSIVPPTRCLCGSLRKVLLDNVAEVWAFSSSQHVRATTGDVESYIKKKGISFQKSCDSPLPTSYRPELDVALDLSTEDASHVQSLVGVLK